jgi:hypothetical protein
MDEDSRCISTVSLTLCGVYDHGKITKGKRDPEKALHYLQNHLEKKGVSSERLEDSLKSSYRGVPFEASFQQHGGNGSAKLVLAIDSTDRKKVTNIRRMFQSYKAPYA